MANWQPWVYPGHWSMDEHNAVLAELRRAEAESERMGKANNEACDRIRELETLNDALVKDLNFYRDEYQPVSAARDAAEARVQELEAAIPQPEDIAGLYSVPELQARVRELEDEHTEAFTRIAELEAQLAAVSRVDPEAWKTEIQIRCATCANEDWLRMSTIPGKVSIIISEAGSACVSNMLPADAARAAVWLASYAQAHGAPVDLGTTVPASQSVEERFGKFLDSGVGGGDDEYLVDAYLRGYSEVTGKSADSISYSRTGIGYVRDAVLAALAQPAPIATPETLDNLAKVMMGELAKTRLSEGIKFATWETLTDESRAAYYPTVVAILRAARPRLEADIRDIEAIAWEERVPDRAVKILALCNDSIRYGVELPKYEAIGADPGRPGADETVVTPVKTHSVDTQDMLESAARITREARERSATSAPTDAQIEALARVLRSTYLPPKGVLTHWEKTCDASRNEWRDVSRAAYAHIGSELAAVTAERDELRRQHQTDGEWIGDTEPNEDDVAKVYTEDDSILSHELYEMIRNKARHTPVERRTMMAHCCAMWKAYHKALSTLSATTAERDALRAELAARATRPVKVRFDVTAGDVSAFIFGNSQSHKEEMSRAMHMLLHHAVIDVPPGVPSVEELVRIYRDARDAIDPCEYPGERMGDGCAAIRDAVLAGAGECQECAKHKKRIDDLETAVDCAHEFLSGVIRRAALEGEA